MHWGREPKSIGLGRAPVHLGPIPRGPRRCRPSPAPLLSPGKPPRHQPRRQRMRPRPLPPRKPIRLLRRTSLLPRLLMQLRLEKSGLLCPQRMRRRRALPHIPHLHQQQPLGPRLSRSPSKLRGRMSKRLHLRTHPHLHQPRLGSAFNGRSRAQSLRLCLAWGRARKRWDLDLSCAGTRLLHTQTASIRP